MDIKEILADAIKKRRYALLKGSCKRRRTA